MAGKSIYATKKRRHYKLISIDENILNLLNAVGAATAIDVEDQRTRFAARFVFEPYRSDGGIASLTPVYTGSSRPPRERRNALNYYPYPFFAASLIGNPDRVFFDPLSLIGQDGAFREKPAPEPSPDGPIGLPCLCIGKNISLAPGETTRLAFIFGYEQGCSAAETVEKYRKAAAGPEDFLTSNGRAWQKRLPSIELPDRADSDRIGRETRWHAYYTRSAFMFDEYRNCHYTPQGGPYEYLHGFRGAIRDIALFLAGIIYLDPKLAAELLEYCFRMMTPTGRLVYAASGFGMETGMMVHENPSDLQLFLLWALTEYVFFTRDFGFLDRETPFHSLGGETSTIFEKVKLALDYLYNKIGFGEHGLIRVGDGDWSDGISLFARSRSKFIRRGESVFNSAMALYALPRAADMIEGRDPAAAARARDCAASLKQAVLNCFNGRWFYRAYDGEGKPIGDSEIFLEHHAWLLISRALPDDMARSVVRNVHEKLDAPSAFGQYILHPPKKTLLNMLQPGWDVNGGVWFAADFLLTWGYGCYDPEKAWASLRKNSMAYKASLDPDLWYGIWSGPDSFNADYSERPGETYFHLPTPSTDFPVMNLNLHAGFLAALVKLCGIEPSKTGTVPRPLLPFDNFRLAMPAFEIESKNGAVSFRRSDGAA